MKKLLYITFEDFSALYFGVNKKILSQCEAFRKHGYDVNLIGHNNGDIVVKNGKTADVIIKKTRKRIENWAIRSVIDRFLLIQTVKKYVKNNKYDYCYIRYNLSDQMFISLLKILRVVCKKIVVEFPTYPYDSEYPSNIMYKPKVTLDKLYREKLCKYVDRIVTFYDVEKVIFGIPVILIPNGYEFEGIRLIQNNELDSTIHVMTVSSMRMWHAYERFIEGLKHYYENEGKRDIVLHLAGEGKDLGLYKELVEKYNLHSHVVFDGPLHGEALDVFFERCQLAIDSLGRHRTNISVLSSLKSREYGAKGIPFINSCDIDIIESDFKYMLKVPADESPIKINDVLEFYDTIFGSLKTRVEVAQEIRGYIESRADMKATLQLVVDYFEE